MNWVILILLGVFAYQGTACSPHWGLPGQAHGVHTHSSYRSSVTPGVHHGPGHIHGARPGHGPGHIHGGGGPGHMRHDMMESSLAHLERGRASHGHHHGGGHHHSSGGHRHTSSHHHRSHHHHRPSGGHHHHHGHHHHLNTILTTPYISPSYYVGSGSDNIGWEGVLICITILFLLMGVVALLDDEHHIDYDDYGDEYYKKIKINKTE